MKRTKLLVLTLVVALMLMGAGYAFWSEALTIDATVDTGELDFGFSDANFSGGAYVSGTAIVDATDDNILSLTLSNMHPGSTATVNFCMNNLGSIGLKLVNFVFEGDNPNLDQLVVLTDNGPVSVKDYFEALEGTEIDRDGKVCKEVVFSVKKCATEENFAELADFNFSIKADVKQYNDDGSCVPEEPEDPVKTGLIFVKTGDRGCGGPGSKDRYVSGTFYYTWDEGENTVAGSINDVRIDKNTSKSYTYDGYTIVIRNNNGSISW